MSLMPHHEDGLSNVELGWLVYCGLIIGMLVVLVLIPEFI